MAPSTPKHGYRGDPYQTEHQRSQERRFDRTPQRLPDYVREVRDAYQSETVTRLHQGGVEWEPATPGDKDAGGSKLGTPRWSGAFRSYIAGPCCSVDRDSGGWVWPMRSAVYRMELGSRFDQMAARFVFLLMRNDYHVRNAWRELMGMMADEYAMEGAEIVAAKALDRWWRFYVEEPMRYR
jgi:hypothetical protein